LQSLLKRYAIDFKTLCDLQPLRKRAAINLCWLLYRISNHFVIAYEALCDRFESALQSLGFALALRWLSALNSLNNNLVKSIQMRFEINSKALCNRFMLALCTGFPIALQSLGFALAFSFKFS
jgi:hypothetical protein